MRALLVVALLQANAYAIVGGAPSDDSTVVALVRGEGATTELVCSGTIVSPNAVLTAAHCVQGDLPDLLASTTRIKPVAAVVSPFFDPTTLHADLALLVFDSELFGLQKAVAVIAPDVGDSLDIVGFGRTAPDAVEPFAQRRGSSVFAERQNGDLIVRGPSLTCEGDSGGPALLGDRIVGVTSSGDIACAEHSRFVMDTVFLEQAIAATRVGGAALGDRCWFAANCANSECTPAIDEPRLSFCTSACSEGACPSGLVCREGACVHRPPSPGAIGSACAIDGNCVDELCLARDGDDARVCTQRCFTDLPGFDCPSGLACEPASDDGEACFRSVSEAGCCSTSSEPGRGSIAIAVLVLAQLLRGRGRPYASRRESSVLREMPSIRAARV